LRSAAATLTWDRIFQASGIAFLFVPISTVAYVGIPPGKTNDASALINLFRNLGGSVGISLAQTMLARRSQFHQARLVEHLTPYDLPHRHALQHLHHILPPTHSPLAALNQSLQQQVGMLSYLDVFHVMALTAVVVFALVFLLGKTEPGQAGAH
jgi:MFS transporter, DHA2 family, multidrug resistance protein